jgi:hypothetical protein
LAISTDACKGLENVVKVVFPQAEQRGCFRHLMQNYVKRYAGVEHMYPATRAYKKVIHEHHLAQVRWNPEVAHWLDTYHSLLWYRSGFNPDIKCDYVTNNIAESFNNWIKDFKDLPVCEIADKIQEKIMELFHRRRRVGQRFQGRILPAVLRVLNARTRGLGHLSYVKGDNYYAEVCDNGDCHSRVVVRASYKECACEEWQHTDLPCQHALCLIIAQPFRDVKMEDFVHEYYSVQKFQNAYRRVVIAVGDKSFWPVVDFEVSVGAPLAKRPVGRQRKNRIKSCLEGGSGKKSSANENEKTRKLIRGKFRCPNCGQEGHRKNSPKCPLNVTKKRQGSSCARISIIVVSFIS